MQSQSNLILKSEFNISVLNEGVTNITAGFDVDTMPLKITFSLKNGTPHFDTSLLYDEERHSGHQELTQGKIIRDITIPKVNATNRYFQMILDRQDNRVTLEVHEIKALAL